MPKPDRVYYYRGPIERGCPKNGRPSYRWVNGYSADGPNGETTFPWLTRRECLAEARADGVRAVFTSQKGPIY